MTRIDIISGFLGAGKTTLIKKLLGDALKGQQVVLIENEFGEIGIDGGFLKDAGIEIREMNSGCICCSLVGDFGKALKKVLETYAPDRILIEPSGVGKLSDVIKAVEKVDSRDLILNSFTTVVDAKKAKIYMKNFGEFFNNQVENANSIILSRTAGMDPAKLSAAIALLREKNPEATLITTPWEELDGKTILAAMEKRSTLEAALRELEQEAETHEEHDHCCHHHDHEEEECSDPDCACHHHHDHEEEECDDPDCACHHHHHHHGHDADEVFVSWGTETPRKFTEDELRHILAQLESGEYGTVLRSKGLVDAADGQWLYFDYVPGEPDIRRGAPGVTGRICVIGSQLKEDKLQALFNV